jgi:hypothetical protein
MEMIQVRPKRDLKFGRFFKKVATRPPKTLERGMNGLAIRADRRNWTCSWWDFYDDKEALITMTEQSVPPTQDDESIWWVFRFVIPLVLPLDQDNSRQISVKLWIHGAALLQQTNAPQLA